VDVEPLAMNVELLAMDIVLRMASRTILRTVSLVDSALAYSTIPGVAELVEASAFPTADPYGLETRFQVGDSVGGAWFDRPGLTQEREAHSVALVSAV
jgi:hypothetical protein